METASLPAMAVSAAVGGCAGEILSLPMDTAKVRMQVANSSGGQKLGFGGTLKNVVANEGITAPWKGLTAGLHRQLLFCTFRIAMYSPVRDLICTEEEKSAPPLFKKISAAMTTGALGMCIANPTDVVKIRLQASRGVGGQQRYSGAIDAYKTIIRDEGVLGLWRGIAPNVVRNSVICAAELASYDQIKQTVLKHKLVSDGPMCHFGSALGAGFVATVVGSPVDVVKTRYMNAPPGTYTGVLNCVGKVVSNNGIAGFYNGFWPNFFRIGWFNVVVFVTYENVMRIVKDVI